MRKSKPLRPVCRACSAVMTEDGRCERCEALAALRRRADAGQDLATGEPAADAASERRIRRPPAPSGRGKTDGPDAGPKKRRAIMAEHECVDGCGAKVSKKGGRCRTCAGLKRRNKKAARPAPPTLDAARVNPPLGRSGAQIARHRGEAPVQTPDAPPPAEAGAAVEDILAGLQVAGLCVKAVEVVSAAGRVRFEVEPAREA